MTHGETIVDEYGCRQESFLVEARSLAGYSGSPVFVYKSAGMDLDTGEVKPHVSASVFLLGVDWCHLSKRDPVLEDDKKTRVQPSKWVRQNTGMAGVIPAWKIAELLNDSEVLELRRKAADEPEQQRGTRTPVIPGGLR